MRKLLLVRVTTLRSGVTLVELLVSVMILGTALLAVAVTLTHAALAIRNDQYRQIALGLAQQRLETCEHTPYDQVLAGKTTETVASLPNGSVTLDVADYPTNSSPEMKNVSVTVTWSAVAMVQGTVSLTRVVGRDVKGGFQ